MLLKPFFIIHVCWRLRPNNNNFSELCCKNVFSFLFFMVRKFNDGYAVAVETSASYLPILAQKHKRSERILLILDWSSTSIKNLHFDNKSKIFFSRSNIAWKDKEIRRKTKSLEKMFQSFFKHSTKSELFVHENSTRTLKYVFRLSLSFSSKFNILVKYCGWTKVLPHSLTFPLFPWNFRFH